MQKEQPGSAIEAANGTYAQLAADVLARAKACGATEADIVVADGETFSVQVRVGAVDRLTKAREKRLGLRVFVGKRSATTSTSDFSKESLDRLVSETCTLANAVVEDQVSGLPDASQMAKDRPDLDLYDETILDTEVQIDWAKRGEAAAFAADAVMEAADAELRLVGGRLPARATGPDRPRRPRPGGPSRRISTHAAARRWSRRTNRRSRRRGQSASGRHGHHGHNWCWGHGRWRLSLARGSRSPARCTIRRATTR